MEKKLSDYLHLYLQSKIKCQRMGEEGEAVMTGISYDDTQRIWWVYFENEESGYAVISDVFPILRPLDDMSDGENDAINKIKKEHPFMMWGDQILYAKITYYLLSQNFDLFGLIESNLAIDAKTIKKQTP